MKEYRDSIDLDCPDCGVRIMGTATGQGEFAVERGVPDPYGWRVWFPVSRGYSSDDVRSAVELAVWKALADHMQTGCPARATV
jgi:hypothetical protein